MKKLMYYLAVCIFITVASAPLKVFATQLHQYSPIIITEVQPGTEVSASQEFIELYNQSHQAVDLKDQGWRLEITTAEATTWSKAKSIVLEGVIQPGSYYLLARNYTVSGDIKPYLADYAAIQFTAALSAPSGHIRLLQGTGLAAIEKDRLEWSISHEGLVVSPAIENDASVFVLPAAVPETGSIKRVIDGEGRFLNDYGAQNFLLSLCPSATANNTEEIFTDSELPVPTSIDTEDQACTPEIPEPETGGGVLVPGDEPPAILLPSAPVAAEAEPQSVLANKGLRSPVITEVLPNPASPQTDAADEFIELFNSNDVPFDLSGYKLTVGLTGSKTYTFPAGTELPAQAFMAFYSADTKASLSNTGGQVRLRDPTGQELAISDAYGVAKDGQSWVLANGQWQWTTWPTPHATNVVVAPAATTKKSAAKTASTTKSATTAPGGKEAVVATAGVMEEVATVRTIHPWILAGAGVFALLYGAYEYRHDVANRIHKLRLYRAARRETRQGATGR